MFDTKTLVTNTSQQRRGQSKERFDQDQVETSSDTITRIEHTTRSQWKPGTQPNSVNDCPLPAELSASHHTPRELPAALGWIKIFGECETRPRTSTKKQTGKMSTGILVPPVKGRLLWRKRNGEEGEA